MNQKGPHELLANVLLEHNPGEKDSLYPAHVDEPASH